MYVQAKNNLFCFFKLNNSHVKIFFILKRTFSSVYQYEIPPLPLLHTHTLSLSLCMYVCIKQRTLLLQSLVRGSAIADKQRTVKKRIIIFYGG